MAFNGLFTISILLLSTSSFLTYYANSLLLPLASTDKVSMGIYYETLCPGSVDFIVNVLPDLFKYDLISIVDLHFYPWGNAHLLRNNTFDCQHGEKECLLNTIQACAIDAWPDVDTHFHFIYCVELIVLNDFSQWETCFDILGLDRTTVDLCRSSIIAKALQFGYAQETEALRPPNQFVPWVVIDGLPIHNDFGNLMSYICEAYKGSRRPDICNTLPRPPQRKLSYKDNIGG